jgi:hypothetical protein
MKEIAYSIPPDEYRKGIAEIWNCIKTDALSEWAREMIEEMLRFAIAPKPN